MARAKKPTVCSFSVRPRCDSLCTCVSVQLHRDDCHLFHEKNASVINVIHFCGRAKEGLLFAQASRSLLVLYTITSAMVHTYEKDAPVRHI